MVLYQEIIFIKINKYYSKFLYMDYKYLFGEVLMFIFKEMKSKNKILYI